jgi:hypothetical protein
MAVDWQYCFQEVGLLFDCFNYCKNIKEDGKKLQLLLGLDAKAPDVIAARK